MVFVHGVDGLLRILPQDGHESLIMGKQAGIRASTRWPIPLPFVDATHAQTG